MQRAVAVPELRGLFASHLNDRSDLFHLAQTARAFESPALDSLWRELPSLIPLLALFPREAVQIRNHRKVG